jgi:hypothetical protein
MPATTAADTTIKILGNRRLDTPWLEHNQTGAALLNKTKQVLP